MSNIGKYVCSVCGSEDVELKAWVRINEPLSTESIEFTDKDCTFDSWCNNCSSHSQLTIGNQADSEPLTVSKYQVRMLDVFESYVTVEATSVEDAVTKANRGEYTDKTEPEFFDSYRNSEIYDVELVEE